jgi:hypothetical protein
MKKSLIIAATLTMLFSLPAFAKIECAVDNAHNAVIYRSYKNIMHWRHTSTFDFMKTVYENNDSFCHVQIKYQGIGFHKRIIENNAEIIIDGVSYPIQKIVTAPSYTIKPAKHVAIADFLVPKEVVDKITSFKDQLWFQFYMRDKDQGPIKLPIEELEEIRLISTLKYEDFDAVESGELKPVDPNAPKPKLSFSERLKLKMQEENK